MLERPVVEDIFRALADPTRRALVERISQEQPISVSALASPFDLTLAAVVQHLQVLESCGLIATEKVGRVRSCRIDPRGLDAVSAWVAARRSTWELRLDALGDLLDADEPDTGAPSGTPPPIPPIPPRRSTP